MIKDYFVFFIVMTIFGIFFNAMNILIYKYDQFYLSLTLLYSGMFMASTMFCAHEVIHFINHGKFNFIKFGTGIVLSAICIILLRLQVGVGEKEWMKRMIPHHSTALTTTKRLLRNHPEVKRNKVIYELAQNIINSQTEEINLMKNLM